MFHCDPRKAKKWRGKMESYNPGQNHRSCSVEPYGNFLRSDTQSQCKVVIKAGYTKIMGKEVPGRDGSTP